MQHSNSFDHQVWIAFGATAVPMACAWRATFPLGLWLFNLVAALCGTFFGIIAIRRQSLPLLRPCLKHITFGAALGIGLTLATQLAARLLLLRVDCVRVELLHLYAQLRMPPGPVLASPILILAVLSEELVFRGAITTLLVERKGPSLSLLLATLLYVTPLLASGSWVLTLVGLLLGAIWTIATIATRRLTVSLVSHLIWSATTFILLPVDVPLLH